MKSKKNRSAKVITASVLGASILASILALPGAEASVKDGRFFVKAAGASGHWSIANFPRAKPGQDGGSTPGPSTSPTGEPSSPATSAPPTAPPTTAPPVSNAVAKFACGPLQYAATQEMLDQASRNRSYYAQNNLNAIVPTSDGWSELYSYELNGSNTDFSRGLRDPLPPSYIVNFNSSVKQPTYSAIRSGADENTILRVSYTAPTATKSDTCSIRDLRSDKLSGNRFYYSKNADESFEDGRYESNNDEIYATIVNGNYKASDGAALQKVTRTSAKSAYSSFSSDARLILRSPTVLSSFNIYEDGRKYGVLYLPSETDNYNMLLLRYEADGTRSVTYRLYVPSSTGSTESTAKRAKAPSKITYDSSGKITELGYYDSSSKYTTLTGSKATVANYNSVTGRNWDGKYDKVESYDFTVPFQPSTPQ